MAHPLQQRNGGRRLERDPGKTAMPSIRREPSAACLGSSTPATRRPRPPSTGHPLPRMLACLVLVTGGAIALAQGNAPATSVRDPAAVTWLMVSTALVLFMVVGLAFFYGGLVRSKNALNTMMMSFVAFGVVGLSWATLGYSFAFDGKGAWVGGFAHALMNGVGLAGDGIPDLLFFCFQGAFAIIAAALISGAIVERMRFGTYVVFIAAWCVLIYAPMAKWVWGGGVLARLGALDFAGGTVVHINAGVAALVLALVVGRRKDFGAKAMLPHQVPFTLLGAGILWFGWFGFNGGSALAANGTAVLAFANTLLAPAAAIVAWALLDLYRNRHVTAVGVATSIVVGLVAITPAAGFVSPAAAMLIGVLATFPSYYLMSWRASSGLDDSLDVFSAHGVGGIVGSLLTGVFASRAWGAPVDGGVDQLFVQLVAVAVAVVFSGIGSYLLARLIGSFLPLRADVAAEANGLDGPMHGEQAYTDGEGAVLIPVGSSHASARIVGRAVGGDA